MEAEEPAAPGTSAEAAVAVASSEAQAAAPAYPAAYAGYAGYDPNAGYYDQAYWNYYYAQGYGAAAPAAGVLPRAILRWHHSLFFISVAKRAAQERVCGTGGSQLGAQAGRQCARLCGKQSRLAFIYRCPCSRNGI